MPQIKQKPDGNYYTQAVINRQFSTFQFFKQKFEEYLRLNSCKVGDDLPYDWWSETQKFRYILGSGSSRTNSVKSNFYNAICPVCGQRVFFYKNDYGSRVFFDELGKPWPLHPCTIPKGQKIVNASPILFTTAPEKLLFDVLKIIIPNERKTIEESEFNAFALLTEVTLHDEIEYIGDKAFYGCERLRKITLPDTICEIGEHAFAKCMALESLVLPKNLKKISMGTFMDCKSLESISIPETITEIVASAFYGCTSLKKVTIFNANLTIHTSAFENCHYQINFSYPNGKNEINNTAITNSDKKPLSKVQNAYETKKTTPQKKIDTIPKPPPPSERIVTKTKNESLRCEYSSDKKTLLKVYNAHEIKYFTIQEGVEIIGESAFEKCETLETVIFPNSLIKIEKRAFSHCKQLDNIKLPKSLQFIGEKAFAGCSKLRNIKHRLSGKTQVGRSAFTNCRFTKKQRLCYMKLLGNHVCAGYFDP